MQAKKVLKTAIFGAFVLFGFTLNSCKACDKDEPAGQDDPVSSDGSTKPTSADAGDNSTKPTSADAGTEMNEFEKMTMSIVGLVNELKQDEDMMRKMVDAAEAAMYLVIDNPNAKNLGDAQKRVAAREARGKMEAKEAVVLHNPKILKFFAKILAIGATKTEEWSKQIIMDIVNDTIRICENASVLQDMANDTQVMALAASKEMDKGARVKLATQLAAEDAETYAEQAEQGANAARKAMTDRDAALSSKDEEKALDKQIEVKREALKSAAYLKATQAHECRVKTLVAKAKEWKVWDNNIEQRAEIKKAQDAVRRAQIAAQGVAGFK
jgi:hypothetical protein